MYNFVRTLVGNVFVEETKGLIHIKGVKALLLLRDIKSIWKTSTIGNNIFVKSTGNTLTFHSFFALEIRYILEQMLENPKAFRLSPRVINKVLKELMKSTWLKKTTELDQVLPLNYKKLRDFNLKPLEHQKEFLEVFNRRTQLYNLNGFMLAAAAGSGKTFTNMALSRVNDSEITIVVCPKNAVYKVWEKSLKDDFKKTPKYWIAADGKDLDYKSEYYIFHYETLDKALELGKRIGDKNKTTIILDESHNFNEIKSMRTQKFIDLCKVTGSKNIVWASGTPLKAMGGEMIGFLKSIDPLFNDDVEKAFKSIFGTSVQRANDILAHRLGYISFKVKKNEYRTAEPTENTVKVEVPNGDKYTLESVRDQMAKFIEERVVYYKEREDEYKQKFYSALEWYELNIVKGSSDVSNFKEYMSKLKIVIKSNDLRQVSEEIVFCNNYEKQKIIPSLISDHKANFLESKSVVKYLSLKIQGEALGRVLGRARVECFKDMAKHSNLVDLIEAAEKKTVIFTSYVEVVDELEERLKNLEYLPVVVHSKTKESLTSAVTRFEKNENLNPLLATFKSLSTAVPLIVANKVIMINAPYRDYEYEQAISRVDRLGQDTPVVIENLYLDTGTKPNISTRSKDIMQWSKEQVKELLGFDYDDSLDISVESLMEDEPSMEAVSSFKPKEDSSNPGFYFIPGYKGYRASEDGKILTIKTGNSTYGGMAGDYLKVKVYPDNVKGPIMQYAHILVCTAFYGKPKKGQVVLHKDNDRTNNNKGNLKWDTQSENIQQVWDDGLRESKESYPVSMRW
ncbi:MAG: HNH endonuclease [Gammaproteobacteria bacterium]|nr:HNH endonuclease [Gammaproteobacteria bacterium]